MGLLMTWSRQNLQPPGQESSLRPVAAVEIFVTVYQLLKKRSIWWEKRKKKMVPAAQSWPSHPLIKQSIDVLMYITHSMSTVWCSVALGGKDLADCKTKSQNNSRWDQSHKTLPSDLELYSAWEIMKSGVRSSFLILGLDLEGTMVPQAVWHQHRGMAFGKLRCTWLKP